MQRATLTSKGQTTIPVAVRKKLGLEPGDHLLFEEREGEFVLRRDPGLDDLIGCVADKVQRRHDPAMTGQEIVGIEKAAAEAGWLEGARAEEAERHAPRDERRTA